MATKTKFNPHTNQLDFILDAANPGISHADLDDLTAPADDHTQYFLLAGRGSSQTAIGGTTGVNDFLGLKGSSHANSGYINLESTVILSDIDPTVGPFAANTFQGVMEWNGNVPSSGAKILAFQYLTPTVTVDSPLFIYSALWQAGTFNFTVTPGFSTFTMFAAQAILQTTTATIRPTQALCYQAAIAMENDGAGNVTAAIPATTGLQFTPQIRTKQNLDRLTVNVLTAVTCSPTYSTVGGTFANFGTIRGLHCNNVVAGFFQPGSGTETLVAYIGVDIDALPFGGNVTKRALRSALTPASNTLFLENTGGAHSNFGSGHIFDMGISQHLGDGVSFSSSYGAAGGDVLLYWDGTDFVFNPLSSASNLLMNFATADEYIFHTDSSVGTLSFDFDKFAFGQSGVITNQVGIFVAPTRATGINGGWSDFLLTQAGNLTINHTMSEVNAWTINAVSLTGGAGTITGYVATLALGGMTTSGLGGAETHSLRHTGRRTGRGVDAFEPLSPSQLSADVNNYAPATGNSMRQVWRVSSDASRTITGIAVQQDSDTQWITNIGANNVVLGHQNGASTATNRIISPTGANLTLGPDESACLWHDVTTDRWRILYHTGA